MIYAPASPVPERKEDIGLVSKKIMAESVIVLCIEIQQMGPELENNSKPYVSHRVFHSPKTKRRRRRLGQKRA